jgi:hypothetical protein
MLPIPQLWPTCAHAHHVWPATTSPPPPAWPAPLPTVPPARATSARLASLGSTSTLGPVTPALLQTASQLQLRLPVQSALPPTTSVPILSATPASQIARPARLDSSAPSATPATICSMEPVCPILTIASKST